MSKKLTSPKQHSLRLVRPRAMSCCLFPSFQHLPIHTPTWRKTRSTRMVACTFLHIQRVQMNSECLWPNATASLFPRSANITPRNNSVTDFCSKAISNVSPLALLILNKQVLRRHRCMRSDTLKGLPSKLVATAQVSSKIVIHLFYLGQLQTINYRLGFAPVELLFLGAAM